MLSQNEFRGHSVFQHGQYLKLLTDRWKWRKFLKRMLKVSLKIPCQCGLEKCLLWSRPVQRNGFGAVKRQLPTIRQMASVPPTHPLSYRVSQKCPNVGDRDVSPSVTMDLCVCADHLSAGQDEINCECIGCVNCGICNGHVTYPPCIPHNDNEKVHKNSS